MAGGAEAVEVDVHLTRDGIPILHHDPTLDGLEVAKTGFGKLRDRAQAHGFELARVADLLEATADRVAVNLEIKDLRAVEPVLDLLEEHAPQPVLLSAFDPRALEAASARGVPGLLTGQLLGRQRVYRLLFSRRRTRRLSSWIARVEPDVVVVHRSLARLGLTGAVTGADVPVIAWTVNRDSDLRRFLRNPLIFGVITDRVGPARRIRNLVGPPGSRSGLDGVELGVVRDLQPN